MENEELDGQEVLETPEEVAEEAEEETPEADEAETLRKEKAELEAKNKQLFERVKKAEKKDEPSIELTAKDALTLAKANISEDDVDELLQYANFKKMSVSEALADPVMKGIIATKEEQRRTAEATISRGGARGSSVTPEDHLRKAELTGEITDIDAITRARMDRRIAQAKR